MKSMSFAGMRIFENPHLPEWTPRMKLKSEAQGLLVSDEMRHRMDKWLLEFFGKDRTILVVHNRDLFTHPNTARIIRELLP